MVVREKRAFRSAGAPERQTVVSPERGLAATAGLCAQMEMVWPGAAPRL
jgi:hypothetical protein